MKDKLIELINGFAKEGIVFSNEQDFQFLLATKLLNLEGVEEVKLEVLSTFEDWGKIEEKARTKGKLDKSIKEYTDIMFKKSGKYYAIELKYKTADRICYYETSKGKTFTMKQGAPDVGAYDYIKDVCRLEAINSRHFNNGINIEKGYAILLTNDRNYRYNDFKNNIYHNYSLCKTREHLNGKLCFRVLDKNKKRQDAEEYKGYKALTVQGTYEKLEDLWKNYEIKKYDDYEDKNKTWYPGFSYIVLEIVPIKTEKNS